MNNIERREYFIEDQSIPTLFLQSWIDKSAECRGTVLITHGIAEHSECYSHVAEALAKEGWAAFAWDLQGHGKSEGKRGYVKNFKEFPRDLKTIIEKIKNDGSLKANPFFLVGHSMGGLITLSALAFESLPPIAGAVFSSPALGIAVEVPKIKEMASHWINSLWPTLTLSNEVKYPDLSRDPQMVDSYSKDSLRHTKVSAPLYLGMVEEMSRVIANPQKITTPVYFQIAGEDKITSAQTSLDFYKTLECEKKLSLYQDSYHEIYNDINKKETIDDLISYLGELSL